MCVYIYMLPKRSITTTLVTSLFIYLYLLFIIIYRGHIYRVLFTKLRTKFIINFLIPICSIPPLKSYQNFFENDKKIVQKSVAELDNSFTGNERMFVFISIRLKIAFIRKVGFSPIDFCDTNI